MAAAQLLDRKVPIDLGAYGYTSLMYVYRNEVATPEGLQKGEVTRAFADAVLGCGASLVGFSSDPDGTGIWQVIPMHPDDAKKYPLGSAVLFHYHKSKQIGGGEHVAITPEAPPKLTDVEAQEHERRVAELPSLGSRAGAAFTFWKIAVAAAQGKGFAAVDWADVENRTIEQSIGRDGQKPGDVARALCQVSPGAVGDAGKAEIMRLTALVANGHQLVRTLSFALDEEAYTEQASIAYETAEEVASGTGQYPKYPEPFNTIGCGYGRLTDGVGKVCQDLANELNLHWESINDRELMFNLSDGDSKGYDKFERELASRLAVFQPWVRNWQKLFPPVQAADAKANTKPAEKVAEVAGHDEVRKRIASITNVGDPDVLAQIEARMRMVRPNLDWWNQEVWKSEAIKAARHVVGPVVTDEVTPMTTKALATVVRRAITALSINPHLQNMPLPASWYVEADDLIRQLALVEHRLNAGTLVEATQVRKPQKSNDSGPTP